MSLAVRAGRLTLTPGRLIWRRLPSLPSVRTSHSTLFPFFGQHLHFNRAVVDQDDVAHADVVDEILVIHVHGMLFEVAFAADREGEFLAGLQIQRHAQVAGADGRSLGVHEDAHVARPFEGLGPDRGMDAAHPVVRGVGHVQAEDVDARVNQLADHFRRIRGGAQGRYDFCAANGSSLHRPAITYKRMALMESFFLDPPFHLQMSAS